MGGELPFNERVGRNLRAMRAWHGYTQEELAEKSGFAKSTIQAWESGLNSMSLENASRVMETMGEPLIELVRK